MIQIKSTKTFKYLPAAHGQWFDRKEDGTPGHCAAVHGYDREVEFTFAGETDYHGWIFPFGDLKDVKIWLEYYFDHVTLLSADDPRLETIQSSMLESGGILGNLRTLPYGVSMEMSSLFIWEHVNPYIYQKSDGRVYVEKVISREHDRNSAFLEVDGNTAKRIARKYLKENEFLLPMKPFWDHMDHKIVLREG